MRKPAVGKFFPGFIGGGTSSTDNSAQGPFFSDIHIFSPSLVNEFFSRFGYVRHKRYSFSGSGQSRRGVSDRSMGLALFSGANPGLSPSIRVQTIPEQPVPARRSFFGVGRAAIQILNVENRFFNGPTMVSWNATANTL